jgi:UDP-galactopyranose mutase
MFEKMLDNTNIKVMLNTKYSDIKDNIDYEKLYYTGSIDEFFEHKF